MPYAVAPLAGAWIEIANDLANRTVDTVAPLAGVWIYIKRKSKSYIGFWHINIL